MAAPNVAVSTDKPTYNVGDTVTATVVYSDPDAHVYTLTGTAVDQEGHQTQATSTFAISDPVTVTVTDDGGRAWTKVSDTGSTAVFTAKA